MSLDFCHKHDNSLWSHFYTNCFTQILLPIG